MRQFDYDEAFSRNLGWLAECEQHTLRQRRVAIVGMGGVGGTYLTTLARLGVGRFSIAEFDTFELANFNRQVGATMDTIGQPKIEVLERMARAINPELDIRRFPEGVTDATVGDFLEGADLFIDGIDFFALKMRRALFAECARRGIPALTAAPIGMGVGYLAFMPGGMTFDEYFDFADHGDAECAMKFFLGLAPKPLQTGYLMDPTRLDFERQRAPSTIAGIQLCAGVVAAETVKILLKRGNSMKPAPHYYNFDAYLQRFVQGRLRGGNRHPLQRLKFHLARRKGPPAPVAIAPAGTGASAALSRILEAGRWAPSGDNSQPWRFEIMGPRHIRIHLEMRAQDNVYEYRNGQPLLLSAGCLLENMRLAAAAEGLAPEWTFTEDGRADPVIDVHFTETGRPVRDPLLEHVWERSVDRRPYRLSRLTAAQKAELEACLGQSLVLTWHEGLGQRWKLARLGAMATRIRTTIPETLPVHRAVIDWARKLSPDRMPAASLGLDRMTLAIMRWTLASWRRTRILPGMLHGTATASLQMDILPGIFSSAFFSIAFRRQPADDRASRVAVIEAGTRLQRLWLTASRHGLALQPGMATLIFAHYGETGEPFTTMNGARKLAARLARAVRRIRPDGGGEMLFLGRVGTPRTAKTCRSTRLPVAGLTVAELTLPAAETAEIAAAA
ncbi:MAG: ThiF family adenylyltransferase [Sphingomonadales bacterium]|nr:ThiF family adenylyltransferase [Sphingomonadales bacterium]